jgi:hypothetical protein
MKVPLPYNDKHIPVEIDDRNFAGALVSKVEEHRPAHDRDLDQISAAMTRGLAMQGPVIIGVPVVIATTRAHEDRPS